jgi:hypothetical protein
MNILPIRSGVSQEYPLFSNVKRLAKPTLDQEKNIDILICPLDLSKFQFHISIVKL